MKPRLPKWFRDAFKGLRIRSWAEVMSGTPCVYGRRVPAECIAGEFAAGRSIRYIAKDRRMRECEVADAIRFALRVSRMRYLEMGNYREEILGKHHV